MKIWIFSDLHLEFGERFDVHPPADTDVVVCAGDLLTRGVVPSIEWLAKNVAPSLPVVFVQAITSMTVEPFEKVSGMPES
ncbi:metallophosphoesterase [Pararhizobium sp. PWRC1-1]|uniref:metallophosphoesterase n=1 Tax=Pararhizobium sp. PWRC1-1 TaxID=2804566 RepID=UPI003CED0524